MKRDSLRLRINHVAVSVDADILDDEGRAALLDSTREVFGWTEGDNSTEKGNRSILLHRGVAQILYLLPRRVHGHAGNGPLRNGGLFQGGAHGDPRADRDYQRKDAGRLSDVGTMVTHAR